MSEFQDTMKKVVDAGLLPEKTPRWLLDKKIVCSHLAPLVSHMGKEHRETALGATKKCIECNVVWTVKLTSGVIAWQREIPTRTFIVYSPEIPGHLLKEGYTNIRQCGYYDRTRNEIVDATDLGSFELVDKRSAPGL